jgi:hypothetical protein
MSNFFIGAACGGIVAIVALAVSIATSKNPKMEHDCFVGAASVEKVKRGDHLSDAIVLPLDCGDLKIEPKPRITAPSKVLALQNHKGPLSCTFRFGDLSDCRVPDGKTP